MWLSSVLEYGPTEGGGKEAGKLGEKKEDKGGRGRETERKGGSSKGGGKKED